jgi:hypothetical protein
MRIPPAIVAWGADRESTGARRWVQVSLGAIWLLDAALQYQPYMFSRAFATGVIEPAGAGSPGFVASPAMFAGQFMLHNEVAFNAVFATIQLALGVGLLCRRSVRAALAGSIVWALSIWWLGEGLGGIFTSTATPLAGAPGAALLYALIAVLAWPARSPEARGASVTASRSVTAGGGAAPGGSVAGGGLLGGLPARLAWLALWGSSAYFLLLAPNRAPGTLRATITAGIAGEPGWIASMDRNAAAAIGTNGTAATAVLAALFAVIAVGVLVPAATRPVLVLAMVTAAVIWVLAQGFGGILTGQGTDPNTGPLLILLAAAFWPLAGASRKLAEASPQAGRSAEASLRAGGSARLPESVAAGARGLGAARVRSQQAVPRHAELIGRHIRGLSPFPGPSGRLGAPNSARE